MTVVKRDGQEVEFNDGKIVDAICKAMLDIGTVNGEVAHDIADEIRAHCEGMTKSVEEIQDMVENALLDKKLYDVAKSYILYRDLRTKARAEGWHMSDLQRAIWENKYQFEGETFDEWIDRVSGGNSALAKLIRSKRFLFGGRILSNRGLQHRGRKVTYSNCYVLEPPKDSIEGIFDTAAKLARTFSYGGGVGIDIGQLRPRDAEVNNAARTTSGAVSFMDLYSLTTGLIGQNGRRGALMISIPSNHPDIEEFIDVKTDLTKVTKANISIRISDAFMYAVMENKPYNLVFTLEDDTSITKEVNARDLFMKLCKNNWDYAEPGILFWNRITDWNLLSGYPDEEFSFAGVNPCAEEPLPPGGSCLIGSMNLSQYVVAPFTERAMFDINRFTKDVKTATVALNEVLDEGLPLHPLKEQRDSVGDWRQIGLGVMGIADMLIKMGITYGSDKSFEICEMISFAMLNASVEQSALLAKEHGPFPKFELEKIEKSQFYQANVHGEVKELVKEYGLRNSQLLTIAPTGSISTMLGISGGIEPIFAMSHTRKTESLHDEGEVEYKVYADIAKEYMNKTGESELPEYFIESHQVDPKRRIIMQTVWQDRIDASISSTINLPNSATVEDVQDLYLFAWDCNLKGLTVYREGCKRGGILTTDSNTTDDDSVRSDEPGDIVQKEVAPALDECST